MGKFYRNGRLWSGDAISVSGTRTLAAATEATIWPGTDASRAAPSSAAVVKMVSTSANDTVGGTGVRAVQLDYLDAAGVRQAETIGMNGVTAVVSVASVAAIIGIAATDIGSNGSAVGTISCKNAPLTTTYEVIPIGANQTSAAVVKVPLAQKGYVASLQLSAGATATTVKLKSDCNPATGAVVSGGSFVWHTAIVGTDPATIVPAGPIGPFPAGATIWLTGQHAAGTAVAGTIEAYYEPAG